MVLGLQVLQRVLENYVDHIPSERLHLQLLFWATRKVNPISSSVPILIRYIATFYRPTNS